MKEKALRIAFLCLVCLLLLACEYEYRTLTLEATKIQSWKESMRSEGWRIVKKEKVGERVYEKTAKEDGGLYAPRESLYDSIYRQHKEVIDLYAVTFRRLVR